VRRASTTCAPGGRLWGNTLGGGQRPAWRSRRESYSDESDRGGSYL
jgi:hypothetical protein